MNNIDVHNHLLDISYTKHTNLYNIILKNELISLKKPLNCNLQQFLSRTIVGQQLSKSAANSIWSRIEGILTAKRIDMANFFTLDNPQLIKSCGVSKNKSRALISLNSFFQENRLVENELEEYPHILLVEKLTEVWGVGTWTAEMASIFYFNNDNVWSYGDASLLRGTKIILSDDNPTLERQQKFTSDFEPFRSHLALHIWRWLDTRC